MVDEIVSAPEFWSQVIAAGKSAEVEFPVETYLTITQAALADLPADGSKDPVRVFADVQTIQIDLDEGEPEVKESEQSKILLVTLLPGEKELQPLNVVFSPLNRVVLNNTGKCDVHLVGFLTDNGLADWDEEEEEEEEEAKEPAEAAK